MSDVKSNGKRKQPFPKSSHPMAKQSSHSGEKRQPTDTDKTRKGSVQTIPNFTRRFNRLSLTDSDSLHNNPLTSHPSNLNIEVLSSKKINTNSFLWKKSNTLLKNLRQRSPKVQSGGTTSPFLAKRQISSISDVEHELDILLK